MTTLSYTVNMPAGASSGTWELTPEVPYSVFGSVGVVSAFRGDINSSGVLTAKGGGTAQVVVPASGGFDAGMGVLTTNFNIGAAILPGKPIRVQLVETSTGVMDVAYLLNTGRGQILTPQQAADILSLIAQTTTARNAANAAAANANSAAAGVASLATTLAGPLIANANAATASAYNAAAAAIAALGTIPWEGGDHTTLPTAAGRYKIMKGLEAGQVWERATNGATPVRQPNLEALSESVAQPYFNTIFSVGTRSYGLLESSTPAEAKNAILAAAQDAVSQRRELIFGTGTFNVDAGATLSLAAQGGPLAMKIPSGTELVIPDGTNTALVISGGLAGPYSMSTAAMGAVSITVTGGTWASGDMILLQSDDTWENIGYGDQAQYLHLYSGEYARVEGVTSLGGGQYTLTLRGSLACPYTINPLVFKANLLKGFRLGGDGLIRGATQAGRNGGMLYLALADNPVVEGINFRNGAQGAMTVDSNLNGQYHGLTFEEFLNDTGAPQAYGYGVVIKGNETGANIDAVRGRNVRHLITTGPGNALDGKYGIARGVPRGIGVHGLVAEYTTSTAFDTHAPIEGLTVTNMTTRSCYGSFGMRGRKISLVGFNFSNPIGTTISMLAAARDVSISHGKIYGSTAAPAVKPSGWGGGSGQGLTFEYDATRGTMVGLTVSDVEIYNPASYAIDNYVPGAEFTRVRVYNSLSTDTAAIINRSQATDTTYTECAAVGGAYDGMDITGARTRVIRPRITANQRYGLVVRDATVRLTDLQGVTGNYLSLSNPLNRVDLGNFIGTALHTSGGEVLQSFAGNPTLATGSGTLPDGMVVYAGVTGTRLTGGNYTEGVAYQFTDAASWRVGPAERNLRAGVAYTMVVRGQTTSGTTTASVIGPRDQSQTITMATLTLGTAALSTSKLDYQAVTFTVPVDGTYRLFVQGTAGGVAILDFLDIEAGQGLPDLMYLGRAQNVLRSDVLDQTLSGNTTLRQNVGQNLSSAYGAAGSRFSVDSPTGFINKFAFLQAGTELMSWDLSANGNFFNLTARSTSGAFLSNPITIDRANGTVTVVFNANSAATTTVLGAVKRAAALTATVPASTALTVSASYVQSEIQAIITRLEQVRARGADLEAKLAAAGITT